MTIPEIKEKLTIEDLVNHYSLKATAVNGKSEARSMHCPFDGHPAAKPGTRKKKTFQIYTDTNRFQCFHKDCSAGNGDVIDFIEKKEGCTKHEAIKKAERMLRPDKAQPSSELPITKADSAERLADTHDASRRSSLGRDRHSDSLHDARSDVSDDQPGEPKEVPGAGLFMIDSPERYTYQDEVVVITVLGGIRLEGLERMRCTLKVTSVAQDWLHGIRHTLDLYHDDQVQRLVRKIAERLEVPTSKSTLALYNLTDHLEAYRLSEIEKQRDDKPEIKPLTENERKEAIDFLKGKELMRRTNELLGRSGIVGETQNRQILWLVYGSRKRAKPLHVICLGASGTGKTYLQEKVTQLIPEHEKFTFTASTENAFYYLDPYDLCHKVVVIEDMDGVQYLLYPLRELQTKHWINKIVPVKDLKGEMKTRKLEVFGPICLSGTTTQEKLYEDNANRCLLLHLDNSGEQQEGIMDYQRKLSAGKIDKDEERQTQQLLQQVQRVLEPVRVINPYAEALRIPKQCFKPLRTHDHYLQFIETVTWYHQFQREEQVDKETGEVYIETTLEDIEIANDLIKDVLLTKSDELPKALRLFFEQLKEWLKAEQKESFYSKDLRTHLRMYPMKVNRHIRLLEQYGYLKKSGGNKKSGYEYEVVDWSDYDRLKGSLNVLDELLVGLQNGQNGVKSP